MDRYFEGLKTKDGNYLLKQLRYVQFVEPINPLNFRRSDHRSCSSLPVTKFNNKLTINQIPFSSIDSLTISRSRLN